MDDPRVPPAVVFTFERVATEVCEKAKLDYYEMPSLAQELVGHLKLRWQEGVNRGLSTEAAEDRTLELFGDPVFVARSYRRPWLRRLLFNTNYHAQRYLMIFGVYSIVWSCLFILSLSSDPAQIDKYKADLPRLIGAFAEPIATIGCIALIRWKPFIQSTLLRCLFFLRYLLLIQCVGYLKLIVAPVYFLFSNLKSFDGSYRDYLDLGIFMILTPFCLITAGCLMAELFDLPGQRKKKQLATLFLR